MRGPHGGTMQDMRGTHGRGWGEERGVSLREPYGGTRGPYVTASVRCAGRQRGRAGVRPPRMGSGDRRRGNGMWYHDSSHLRGRTP